MTRGELSLSWGLPVSREALACTWMWVPGRVVLSVTDMTRHDLGFAVVDRDETTRPFLISSSVSVTRLPGWEIRTFAVAVTLVPAEVIATADALERIEMVLRPAERLGVTLTVRCDEVLTRAFVDAVQPETSLDAARGVDAIVGDGDMVDSTTTASTGAKDLITPT